MRLLFIQPCFEPDFRPQKLDGIMPSKSKSKKEDKANLLSNTDMTSSEDEKPVYWRERCPYWRGECAQSWGCFYDLIILIYLILPSLILKGRLHIILRTQFLYVCTYDSSRCSWTNLWYSIVPNHFYLWFYL